MHLNAAVLCPRRMLPPGTAVDVPKACFLTHLVTTSKLFRGLEESMALVGVSDKTKQSTL